MEKEIKRFGDIDERWHDIDEWVSVEDILDKDILELETIDEEGNPRPIVYALTTGAKVVMKKVMDAKEKGLLPLTGCIKKVKRYYDIV